MPEGDTIHIAAARLRGALRTGPLAMFAVRTSARAPGTDPPRPGDAISSIEARGKHLLIGFGNGTILHTHLGMLGAWRIRPGRPDVALPHARTGVAMATVAAGAVCRTAPVVELLDDAAMRRHPVLRALGPDLCEPDADLGEVLRRARRLEPTTPIGVALLDQRVAAGIGNVYRAEVLWACRLDPWAPLASVDDERLLELYATSARLLQANLTGRGPRRTVPEGLAVYDRAGRPCLRCSTPIRVSRLGDQARTAWWCPSCQTPR